MLAWWPTDLTEQQVLLGGMGQNPYQNGPKLLQKIVVIAFY